MVVENLSLADQIGQLDIYCDFGISEEGTQDPDGCPDVLKLSERKAHREECVYAPVNCPNSPDCTGLRKHELPKHLEECKIRRCSFNASGCQKIGEIDLMKEHETSCIFALMGNSLSQAIDNKIKERDEKVVFPSIKRLDDRISQEGSSFQSDNSFLINYAFGNEPKSFHSIFNKILRIPILLHVLSLVLGKAKGGIFMYFKTFAIYALK